MLWVASAGAALAQISILQIQVVEGEGVVHVPGVRGNRAMTVTVSDETGKSVAGAAVSFQLPETGPGGTFTNGLRTDVAITDARGRASVRAFQANRVPGRFQIRIVASKEQARAGTVSFQYVGELTNGAAAPLLKGHRKWIAIAAAVAAGTLSAAVVSRKSPSAAASTPVPPVTLPPVPAPASPSIGAPTISVGKP